MVYIKKKTKHLLKKQTSKTRQMESQRMYHALLEILLGAWTHLPGSDSLLGS